MDSSTQIKHLVDVAWRRKWWIVVPTVLCAAASLALVVITPNVYRASTTILVTRQSVPEDMVRSTVTLRIEERMKSLQVQVFSRAYLEQIAREFKMIPANASEAETEEVYRKLHERIIPELDTAGFSWFRISVEDVDPKRAAGIANRLAGLFIEQNSRMRASQAAGTLEATENWEERYRLELTKRDKDIAAFNQQNIYDLPDQQPANLQLLSSAQNRAMQLTSDIQSRSDRLVALRTQQQARRAIDAASGVPDAAAWDDDASLATLQRELAELLEKYTEQNPLVKRKRERIADLVRMPPVPAVPGAPANRAAAARLDPVSVQIVTIENEIKALERDRERENAGIEAYRARIGKAPQLEQKLLELTRDYEQVKHQFDTAVAQKEQAQRSQDLEASKKGEQFQIQDRAYPPVVPYKPDFGRYLLMGVGLGLAIGVGATAAWEFVDQTVRSEEEFAVQFPDLPVYGVIPSLDVDPQPRGRSYASVHGAGSRAASILFAPLPALLAGLCEFARRIV